MPMFCMKEAFNIVLLSARSIPNVITSKFCIVGGVPFLAKGWKIGRSTKFGGGVLKFFKALGHKPKTPSLTCPCPSVIDFYLVSKYCKGLLGRWKPGLKCTFIITQFHRFSATYSFWSMTDRKSGDKYIFNGQACCHPGWHQSSDLARAHLDQRRRAA